MRPLRLRVSSIANRRTVAGLAVACVVALPPGTATGETSPTPLIKLPPEHLSPQPSTERPGPGAGWVVAPGDNLWSIAERTLSTYLGTSPKPTQVDPFWRQIVRLNIPELRSGDPDLIHPGEVVTLPALDLP
jgi:nucleoid-associated protein YgaU